MSEIFSRTEALLGKEAMKKLKSSRVALFGLGGVGSAAFEALVRSGVGHIEVFDHDVVSETHLNRQLLSTAELVGCEKTRAAVKRAGDISGETEIIPHDMFYLPENADGLDLSQYDYIVDAIDTVAAKVELIVRADKVGTKIISSMGTGNKLHPELFEIADIYKTSVCPLAKVMRYELKKRGVNKLKVLYSKEEPIKNQLDPRTPMSISFVPSAAGLIIAGEVIKDIIKKEP